MAAIASAGQPLHRGAPSSSRTKFELERRRTSRVTDAAIVLGRDLDRATTWTRQKPSKTAARDQKLWAASPRAAHDTRRTDAI